MSTAFCSRCATPMTPVMLGGKERSRCPACGFVLWCNPAPVGMALIEHEDRLVLIRRAEPPLAGHWAPPAGYVECGESVPDAVRREALEECGLEIVVDDLLGVYSEAAVDVLIIAYRARSIGGALRAGDDATEAQLFARGSLPLRHYPTDGTTTDKWLFDVIGDTIAKWRDATPNS